jgi:hypothetical protein
MTFLTAAGALAGAYALPLISRAFLTGLQLVLASDRPPEVDEASLQPAACAWPAVPERATKASAARAAAMVNARRAMKLRCD